MPTSSRIHAKTTPQKRHSQDMMQWSMRQIDKLSPAQNTEFAKELRDIEAAEKGDANSEWYKRLEAAEEGAKLATMTAAPAIVGAEGYKTYSDLPDVQVEADAAGEIDAKSSFTRDILLSRAKNPKVINAVKQLYRPGAYTGDGGTAAAIRNKISTGLPTNGKSHIQKGQDWLRALTKIRSNERLTQDESIMLDELIDDLQRALKGE